MTRLFSFSTVGASLALAGLTIWSGPFQFERSASSGAAAEIPEPATQNGVVAGHGFLAQSSPQSSPQSQVPSDAEIHERAQKLIENQHRDDAAIDQYERIEHQVNRTAGANPRVLEDKLYRVVPTGTGTMKILLKEANKPTDPVIYRQQLQTWKELLELALKPDDPRAKLAYSKWQKKKTDRADLVDATREAFLTKSAGQETLNGRPCDVFELNPNPSFHPHSIFQDAMTHITAKIWVDHEQNQVARAEAHVMRDISFGGGILGKLYRGGVFSFQQAEVSPGVWLPARYQYDFMGRKFLFTFEEHQYIEASQYRQDGLPKQALALVESEIAGGKAVNGDP
jgi:hypothetical protein